MERKFKNNTFKNRLTTMLKVDFRRMFKMPLAYIMIGVCFVMPILILVMTTMMAGTTPIDHQTGLPGEPIEAFESVWQIIGTVSTESGQSPDSAGMSMSLTSMCNVNMLYFLIAVLVCIFVSDDFRCGYAKNLFTVRAKKSDYVISKTVVCFVGGMLMILAFFVGSMIGGAVSSLPFEMVGFNFFNLIMCLVSKLLLVSVFVPIYLVMSVCAKQRLWLSLVLSFMVGMFLFMMIPMITPLDATPMHAILCVAGGALFGIGLGAVSNTVLNKTSLV